MRSWFHSYRTAVWKPWCSPPYHQHHQHFIGFWFCTTRLQNYCQNIAQKNPPSIKMYWKTTVQSQTCHFCQKFLKRSFYTNILHTSKKTISAILSNQPTYHTGHSTETALLRIVNNLLNAMNEDKISILLLLDLSAVFDTINHQIILSRLETVFGIRSTALRWFWLYLLDRNQCVVVNNSASSSSPVMFGVPQGSVLGPVLFVLYTTPLSDIIANHSVNHQLFADDTQLQKSTPPNDMQSLTHDLQSCTDDIKAWMCNNQLNEDKTEAILFLTPFLSSCHCLPSSIMVSTHEILFSDKVRNLGFILDSNLTMKQHVIKTCQTAYY